MHVAEDGVPEIAVAIQSAISGDLLAELLKSHIVVTLPVEFTQACLLSVCIVQQGNIECGLEPPLASSVWHFFFEISFGESLSTRRPTA